MINIKFVSAVVSMGYRKMSDDLYSKPVGFGIFVISLNDKTIAFNFAAGDKTLCWSTKPIDVDKPLESIKEYECYNLRKSDNRGDNPKSYEFLTPEQQTELLFEL